MNKQQEILIKIIKKIKLNKAIYSVLNFFIERKEETKGTQEARNELNGIHKYKDANILTKNTIEENLKYDLQIVVPVYNVEKYLDKCLSSLVKQNTKYKYCVYVINDGSTDESRNIINKYLRENVYVIDQVNSGLSAARNTGIKNIVGKYILFVDSDDYISNDCVEKLLNCAYLNNANIVEGSYVSFNSSKTYRFINKDRKINSNELSGFAWNKLFKSSIYSNLVFPEKYLYEDTMPYFLIFPICKNIYTISDITYCHLINEKGIAFSNNGKPKSIDSYWLTELLDETRKKLGYSNDIEYFDLLKKQFIMNYRRTSLLPVEIQKDIFVLERDILKKNNYIKFQNDEFLNYIYNGFFKKYLNYVKWY